MTPPVRFLIGTIVVGILVLVICGLLLRRPVSTNPFDQPATVIVGAVRLCRDGKITGMCRNIRMRSSISIRPRLTKRFAPRRFSSSASCRALPSHRRPTRRAFDRAVNDVAAVARTLIDSLVTTATPRDREEWAARAKERAAERFARP